MCIRFRKGLPRIEFDPGWKQTRDTAKDAGVEWWLPIAFAFVLGIVATAALMLNIGPRAVSGRLTKTDADHALALMQRKMPNTPFVSARVDHNAPWLVALRAKHSKAPVLYDPAHHALVIGLVVNFDNPEQRIAPGVPAGGGAP
ncbi:MAG: hypothetical protein L0H29_01060 [Sinobacteraceae bacterium]|nr:hypothetical protein [Nevskiaceae bacterium]